MVPLSKPSLGKAANGNPAHENGYERSNMAAPHFGATRTSADRVPRRFWIGLVAVVVYLLLAAVLGNLLDVIAPTADPTSEFALTHYIPLPIAIIGGLIFVRLSGWSRDVWHETPTTAGTPRRRWLISIPLLMLALPLSQVFDVPWADRGFGTVLVILLGTAMVGIGEELYFRGILLTSIRAHHGELVTLLATSFIFAACHVVGSVWAGVPLSAIGFQVVVLAMNGSLYYWARRVSGGLWVPMVIHALTDGILYLVSGSSSTTDNLTQGSNDDQPVAATIQIILIVLSAFAVVSAVREDARNRRIKRADNEPAPTDSPAASSPPER
jgi:membrane protease YdiL (CAAX protease family)